jgi:hypothetical protein
MKPERRTLSPEVIAVKVPAELAVAIRRQAREDDRTVSGYLRRLLAAAVHHPQRESESR